ncbi:MAG TPA: hypothetical protein VK806_11720 [Bacteroidia bacterium]|jgi:hypothetical protein|nr:hypothetical protein [Bacteroidia bacterium]
MGQIRLIGTEKRNISEEINGLSRRGITFKKITIQNEDCSNFQILYEIVNTQSNYKFSSPIHCLVSPYQKDVSQVKLNKSLLIAANSELYLQMYSPTIHSFKGVSIIDYEIFEPVAKKVFITETDRQNAYRVALINLARFFGIPNWEYDNNITLFNKLQLIQNPIIELLKNYFLAYDEWFEFYVKLKNEEAETGVGRILNQMESKKLSELIEKRQDTLNALQAEFDKLQFDLYKRQHGLENVKGITE